MANILKTDLIEDLTKRLTENNSNLDNTSNKQDSVTDNILEDYDNFSKNLMSDVETTNYI